ncbi:MAG: DNA polymerase III subunit gamma/tau, partial [Chloroflexota bacterium]|nr:DNA polymerase III subunit gamma/tau [Chloroflexota bacterium]
MIAPSLFGDDLPTVTPAAPAAPAPTTPAATANPGGSQTRSLYRKYRPATFAEDELVGQEVIVRTLRNAIARDRLGHAYLFCGPRGTGKTTTARLLAKAVNCLDPDPAARPCGRCANCVAIAANATTDVVEIDAASNRGIDDIRELRERVKYAPTHLRTKFYIIDEAHQITGAAANAFLKTLEEPPGHTKFVLATTDPEELLQTIVSRCQRFDFRRIGLEPMVARLATVARAEGLTITEEALQAVARAGTGSLRDAIGLLDQLAVYEATPDPGDARAGASPGGPSPEITVDAVRALLGISRNDRIEEMAEALAAHDARRALVAVNQAVEAGEDPRQLNRQFVAYLRVLLHERAGGSPDADERAREIAKLFSLGDLATHARLFSEADQRIRHAPIAHLPLELALVDAVLYGQGAAVAGP